MRAHYHANKEKYAENYRRNKTAILRRRLYRRANDPTWWTNRGLPVPTRPEPKSCECCGLRSDQRLQADHIHGTAKFRGWLCGKCNRGIGSLGDTLKGIRRALAYLLKTRTTK